MKQAPDQQAQALGGHNWDSTQPIMRAAEGIDQGKAIALRGVAGFDLKRYQAWRGASLEA
jgi:hydrogenase maturation factor HypF (carbamoyltransferase family)